MNRLKVLIALVTIMAAGCGGEDSGTSSEVESVCGGKIRRDPKICQLEVVECDPSLNGPQELREITLRMCASDPGAGLSSLCVTTISANHDQPDRTECLEDFSEGDQLVNDCFVIADFPVGDANTHSTLTSIVRLTGGDGRFDEASISFKCWE